MVILYSCSRPKEKKTQKSERVPDESLAPSSTDLGPRGVKAGVGEHMKARGDNLDGNGAPVGAVNHALGAKIG